jgi:antitoxin MazE
MKAIHVSLRQIGNSKGVVIPKPLLAQAGLEDTVQLSVEGDAIMLRRAPSRPREGWAEAAQALSEQAGDELVMGEFGNEGDAELAW